MQLPQHHQVLSRKCTEGVYLMPHSQSALIAAHMSLILKECFLFEISKKEGVTRKDKRWMLTTTFLIQFWLKCELWIRLLCLDSHLAYMASQSSWRRLQLCYLLNFLQIKSNLANLGMGNIPKSQNLVTWVRQTRFHCETLMASLSPQLQGVTEALALGGLVLFRYQLEE